VSLLTDVCSSGLGATERRRDLILTMGVTGERQSQSPYLHPLGKVKSQNAKVKSQKLRKGGPFAFTRLRPASISDFAFYPPSVGRYFDLFRLRRISIKLHPNPMVKTSRF
jgi:hypothetical protein